MRKSSGKVETINEQPKSSGIDSAMEVEASFAGQVSIRPQAGITATGTSL